MTQLNELIQRLENIAEKNYDHFEYRIDIEVQKKGKQVMGVNFIFVAEEKADNHVFVEGRGYALDLALNSAKADIVGACEVWGYVE